MDNRTLRKPAISITPEEYKTLSQQYTPKPTLIKNVVRAFVVGGIICAIGQIFINLFVSIGLSSIEASTAGTATMIFIGALLTGLGLYDEIGKFGGAGSIVPVTGFANSIVAPAMEFKREGYVLGVGAKLFTIAGPVLVYGIATSIVIGLVYFLLH
ncbi:stage V sporulation protein AC [Desulfosporosinus fructosivorans]|uniref:Stage V sporulation protein AC n=1 Tax=Desulfosporosinus fructosivorans TaxID=2018669 RepID=A0A4Z0R3W1_9FIRM|nr:stage V sporulation protein AC [Desulfosporosinus fructosivorans]TGE37771.1 stage V sporulation protein AC [Desulfosporosinus fructosivorans]